MGLLNHGATHTGEVSKQTIQFCVYATVAVALAEILGTLLEIFQYFLAVFRDGRGIFRFENIKFIFWAVLAHALIIICAALLAYFINKRMRDAAVAAMGFCLARACLLVVPFFRSLFYAADSAPGVIIALEYLLLLGTFAGAASALFLLLRRWPAHTKPAV